MQIVRHQFARAAAGRGTQCGGADGAGTAGAKSRKVEMMLMAARPSPMLWCSFTNMATLPIGEPGQEPHAPQRVPPIEAPRAQLLDLGEQLRFSGWRLQR